MGKELVISTNRHETKVAVLEDDQLVEIYFQRSDEYSLAGSIHKGRVTRVLPGMQSAFVDIGLERDAFLYVSDFFEDNEEYERVVGAAEEKVLKAEREGRVTVQPAPAPVAAPEPEPARAPVVAPPAAVAPPAERSEEGEFRDRRGRRTRRRRTRGRGFPDSKYASVRTEEVEEPSPVAEDAAPAVATEFSVLPGESLAKYRGSEGGHEDSGMAGPDLPLEVEEAQAIEEEAALQDPTLAMAPPLADEEPAEQPCEEVEPEPPLAVEPLSEELAAAPETASAIEPEAPVAEVEPVEVEAVEVEEVEEIEESAIAEPIGEDELTAAETQAAAEEVAPEGVEAESGIEPARMPVSLTATLREQGYRYMQRTSRRMRRKQRVGGPESQPQAEPVAIREPVPADGRRQERPAQPLITELLKEGREILVQIAKEPLGQKGARITSHIALPGRYVVYMPTVDHLGVSRKIASEDERLRLKRILLSHRGGMSGGFIVRTAGEGRTEDDITSDMRFLYNLWLDIRQKAEARPAPALIHHDLDVVHRILRDQMTENFKTVWADNEEVYESVLRFVQRFQSGAVGRVKLYTRPAPIFDSFNITAELEKALRPKMWLKSGGYIVINQTEALVAIDVNTGKFVGKSNRLEDTIVKTNTEAVKEIVRQIRLRDLGGIIVVDFIDMDERKNRQKVMQALEEAMQSDRAPNKMLQFNDFGLVAITRKRVKQSLERALCSPCPYCEGAGYVKSVQTVINEILVEAQKLAKVIEGKDATLRVNPEVAKLLKASDNDFLEEIEEVLGRPVLIRSDPNLQQEKFDLV
jgi:ribonuclease G